MSIESDSARFSVADEYDQPRFPIAIMHPEYRHYDERLKSLLTWPKAMAQTPKDLARAGFFYTGKSDKCLCYCCGVGIYQWKKDDNPFIEHCRWSPLCRLMIMIKGADYIENVIRQKPPYHGSKLRHYCCGKKR